MASLPVRGSVVSRTALACVVGAAVTVLILATPYVTFGFESASAHLVLNSLDACVGLLVAYLVHGRFLRHHRLQDLLLSQGLAMLVIAGLGLGHVADLRTDVPPGTIDVWLPLTIRFLGALLIVAAALAGPRRAVEMRSWHRWAGGPTVGIVVVVGSLLWIAAPVLPLAMDLGAVPSSAQRPILTGHPLLLVSQFLAAVCFGLAAFLFTAEADRSDNELLRWLGPACALGAFARLNYFLYPSLYTDWMYTGDLLRTGFYLLLLIGAMREIRQYWTDRADLAVLDDRRRLARELHDGVIQELTYIRAETLRSHDDEHSQLLSACDRALAEARAAVLALGSQGNELLSTVLERAARQLAEQHGLQLQLELAVEVDAEPDQRHALVRILREAVTNAVRHGHATHICVTLCRRAEGRALRVEDNGSGFDVPAIAGREASLVGGYGMISMHDRARALPGSLEIQSTRGAGSVVEVGW